MIQTLWWNYAFNLIINSFLTFFTVTLLIFFVIFVFRLKQLRLITILICIPFIKLLIDPFFYSFENWALLHGINPLQAEEGSRTLAAYICYPIHLKFIMPVKTGVSFTLHNGMTFSPSDIIALSIDPFIMKVIISFVCLTSTYFFARYVVHTKQSLKILSMIVKKSSPYQKKIHNKKLFQKLKQTQCQLIVSSQVNTPCAFGVFHKWVCLPSTFINCLTQKEIEVIIAHELEHLRWYDGVTRFVCHGISHLFWWIPSSWCLRHLENVQEKACDAIINHLNMSKIDLANALIKAAKIANQNTYTAFSTCFVLQSPIVKRMKYLMKEPKKKKKLEWMLTTLVVIIASSFFFGKFWIF